MNPLSTNHNVLVVVNTDDLDRQTGNVKDLNGLDFELVAGPSQDRIRGMLTSNELDVLMSLHGKAIQAAIAAAAKDGITVTVNQVADPTKFVVQEELRFRRRVPALGMGFGMTKVELRPVRDVVSENYEMIGERKAQAGNAG